jgi:CRP-like cAMP-binding protein
MAGGAGPDGSRRVSGASPPDRRALLASAPLFAKLDPRDLDALVQVSRLRRLAPREELVHKGDEGGQIFLIAKGRLKATATSREGTEVTFSIMGPGEVCGELALLVGGRRTASMAALDDCEVLVLDRRDFLPVLRSRPEVAIRLLEVLAERVRRITELMEDVQFLNLPSRLAKKLLHLARSYGTRTSEGVQIDLRLSQADLGELVGTSRESVNKQMRTWTDEGIASMRSGVVTIHRVDALESLSGLTED